MTPTLALMLFFQALIILLLSIWWLRWTSHGLEWVTLILLLAIGMSYVSTWLFRAPPYQAGCDGICAGWWGAPVPVYQVSPEGFAHFQPLAFVRNVLFYDAVMLAFFALIAWAARGFHWTARSWRQKLLFILFLVLLPLATLPMWAPPPQPEVSGPAQRLAINAARDWRWQLRLRSLMDRRLALEDVRPMPDAQHQRVCFRIYTWFYLPYKRVYIDLEPEGVRALAGAEIPLSDSCWTQP